MPSAPPIVTSPSSQNRNRQTLKTLLHSKNRRLLFTSPIALQPTSPLLSLPAELRVQIYSLVFSPPFLPGSAKNLALLSTCRLLNSEALHFAFQRTEFHIETESVLKLRGLRDLGALQKQLRKVEISVPLANLDAVGDNNPFLLAGLQLDMLRINLTHPEGAAEWRKEIRLYRRLVSAFLYRSTPSSPPSSSSSTSSSSTTTLSPGQPHKTIPIHTHPRLRCKRLLELKTGNFRPLESQMIDSVRHIKAKELVVSFRKSDDDVLWNAFTHFGLVDRHTGRIPGIIVRREYGEGDGNGKGREEVEKWSWHYMFFDEGEVSYFRLVRVPVREGEGEGRMEADD